MKKAMLALVVALAVIGPAPVGAVEQPKAGFCPWDWCGDNGYPECTWWAC